MFGERSHCFRRRHNIVLAEQIPQYVHLDKEIWKDLIACVEKNSITCALRPRLTVFFISRLILVL